MKHETPTVDDQGSAIPIPGFTGSTGLAGHDTPVLNPSHRDIGLVRSADHQYWFAGVGPYPSVTTILAVLSKDALIAWAKRVVAEQAVWHFDELATMIRTQGPDVAIGWLKRHPDAIKSSAARLGTGVHLLADLLGGDRTALDGFQISDEARPYVEAFQRFLDDYGASSIVSSEHAVINFTEMYAGTYDLILKLPTGPGDTDEYWMADIKTSRQLYPETGLQLAAYGHAEYIILPEDPTLYPVPPITRYGVVHLRPDTYPGKGYRFAEYQVRDQDYRAFLSARDLYYWRKEGRFKDNR